MGTSPGPGHRSPQHQACLLGSSSRESLPFPATVELSLDIKQTCRVEHIWRRISSESEGNGASEGGGGGMAAGWAPEPTSCSMFLQLSVRILTFQSSLRVREPRVPRSQLATHTLVLHPAAQPACIQDLLSQAVCSRKGLPSLFPSFHGPISQPPGGAHRSPNHRGSVQGPNGGWAGPGTWRSRAQVSRT